MLLNQFSERDQNKIVALAIKLRDYVVEFDNKVIQLPEQLNALFVCSDYTCKAVRDVVYYRTDVINGGIPRRIQCKCGQLMTRKFIGVNIANVMKKFLKKPDDYGKDSVMRWFDDYSDQNR